MNPVVWRVVYLEVDDVPEVVDDVPEVVDGTQEVVDDKQDRDNSQVPSTRDHNIHNDNRQSRLHSHHR